MGGYVYVIYDFGYGPITRGDIWRSGLGNYLREAGAELPVKVRPRYEALTVSGKKWRDI